MLFFIAASSLTQHPGEGSLMSHAEHQTISSRCPSLFFLYAYIATIILLIFAMMLLMLATVTRVSCYSWLTL